MLRPGLYRYHDQINNKQGWFLATDDDRAVEVSEAQGRELWRSGTIPAACADPDGYIPRGPRSSARLRQVHAPGRYVARIDGTDPQYGLRRSFQAPAEVRGDVRYYAIDAGECYEGFALDGSRTWYTLAEDGRSVELLDRESAYRYARAADARRRVAA